MVPTSRSGYTRAKVENMKPRTFVDVFSGCGGLSLGLTTAGLEGIFAIERDAMAFQTFEANFLGDDSVLKDKFKWPSWLAKRAWPIDDFLRSHQPQLEHLRGAVDILAGGPPCQGFSFAGRRDPSDPRNMLFQKYVEAVKALKPQALVLENVPGMKVAHSCDFKYRDGKELLSLSFYDLLRASLDEAGYDVLGQVEDAQHFGVPQRRTRLLVFGIRKDLASRIDGGAKQFFAFLEARRTKQLVELGLPYVVTAKDALSDLEQGDRALRHCEDPASAPGFLEICYDGPRTRYQKLMHAGVGNTGMDSMRLARHSADVAARFQLILDTCRRGVRMNEADREKLGLKKHRIFPMAPYEPSPTITTLPDDVLHYSEPRILTVRESARLQSFPDWFHFRGKYTTGGHLRTKECPRYTQVGNAVPPLLGRAIGLAIRDMLNAVTVSVDKPTAGAAEPRVALA